MFEKLEKQPKNEFQEFADSLPQIIFETDTQGRFTFINRFGIELSGYSERDFRQRLQALDLVIDEDKARATEGLKAVFMGKATGRGEEYMAKKKNGETFPVLVYSRPLFNNDKIAGMRGMILDISARKEVERELKIKHDAIESSVNGIAIADLKNNLTYANPSFIRMWG